MSAILADQLSHFDLNIRTEQEFRRRLLDIVRVDAYLYTGLNRCAIVLVI
jgi:hypothetical protein